MKVAVFGLGYVGCVSAVCLADIGHEVIGVDVAEHKVRSLNEGVPTVAEPGLEEMTAAVVGAGRLRATTRAADAVAGSELALVCVGTPSAHNGALDTGYVERVCREIGEALERAPRPYVVVVRSTVLPGTARNCLQPLLWRSAGIAAPLDAEGGSGAPAPGVRIAVNPEFLREGSAVADFHRPSVVVVGAEREADRALVARLYEAIDAPVVTVELEAAELVKYANNAFHALKIAFANEIGAVAKAHGVDGRKVMEIVTMDSRLNVSKAYLRPGFAFGGSCLPKDLRALVHRAVEADVEVPMLAGILASNAAQIERAVALVERFGRRKVGILGLAFKAGTDDVRESPSVPLIETLTGRGHTVLVHDDAVQPDRLFGANRAYVERELPHIASMMRVDLAEVVAESELIVIANGSPLYRGLPGLLTPDQEVIDLAGVLSPDAERSAAGPVGLSW